MQQQKYIPLIKFVAVSLIFSCLFLCCSFKDIDTIQSDSSTTISYTLDEMRTIALNALHMDFEAASDNGSWDNTQITKETPIYDLDNTLSSYCFDLKCEQQTAYIIISSDNRSYPIKQFCNHAVSPYFDIEDAHLHAAYFGPGAYYSIEPENDTIENLVTGETIEFNEAINNFNDVFDKTNQPSNNYNDITNQYISGAFLEKQHTNVANSTYPTSKNLTSVPNYQWYKGCAPTSMAMILRYHYNGLCSSSNALIDELADNMGTLYGYTSWNSVKGGTSSTLYYYDKNYTSLGFAKTLLGEPLTGSSYNTLNAYKDEIIAGRPVFIAMMGAKATTGGYPSGFGDHATVGVGYSTGTEVCYIIMHTTQTSDGDTYVPLSDESMGKYAWFYVVP